MVGPISLWPSGQRDPCCMWGGDYRSRVVILPGCLFRVYTKFNRIPHSTSELYLPLPSSLYHRPSQKKIGKAYSVKSSGQQDGDQDGKVKSKPSILQKGRTFIAKTRPAIGKKYEPEELQFILLMFLISVIFYFTFLPVMVRVVLGCCAALQ